MENGRSCGYACPPGEFSSHQYHIGSDAVVMEQSSPYAAGCRLKVINSHLQPKINGPEGEKVVINCVGLDSPECPRNHHEDQAFGQ